MKFNYVCKADDCLKKDDIVVIDKCPCKAFTKEHCETCGEKLEKKSKRDS